jgi:hypothetical protein
MDAATLNEWRGLIKKILTELASIPYAGKSPPKAKTVFDESADAYLVVVEGWDDVVRLHGCVAHLEIRGDKIWILLDGTEYGLATELMEAGVPKDRIVLGFKSPRSRAQLQTGFAVA